jgi:hypothetical protein
MASSSYNPYGLLGVPLDFVDEDPDGNWFIDFTRSDWVELLELAVGETNTRARRAAIEDRDADDHCLVNREWFRGVSWRDLHTKPYRAQALLIAAYGEEVGLCAKSSAQARLDKKGCLPFRTDKRIPGHFGSACANCWAKSYAAYCYHNRTSSRSCHHAPPAFVWWWWWMV